MIKILISLRAGARSLARLFEQGPDLLIARRLSLGAAPTAGSGPALVRARLPLPGMPPARTQTTQTGCWQATTAERSGCAEWRRTLRDGHLIPAKHESRYWHPDTLPGKHPFDLAHAARNSRVTAVVGDFMAMELAPLGQFDVVLFLGVLYHLTDALGALRRVARVTAPDGLAIIETEAMEAVGLHDRAYCEFFPGEELNHDASNWWAPNATALDGLCHAAGFQEVTILRRGPHPDGERVSARHSASSVGSQLGRRSAIASSRMRPATRAGPSERSGFALGCRLRGTPTVETPLVLLRSLDFRSRTRDRRGAGHEDHGSRIALLALEQVPEPTTFLLFGSTMAGLGLAARWRRHRQN
jgi:SAM-dependent methyltransferase